MRHSRLLGCLTRLTLVAPPSSAPDFGSLWTTVTTGTFVHFSVVVNSFQVACRLPFLADRQRFTRLLNPEGFALAKTTTKTAKKSASAVVTIDNRKGGERRSTAERRKEQAVAIAKERRVGERREKVNRRRQIDPTTCERDYTDAEVEFMHALDQYKRASGRMFPTCSEVLEVLISLGYEKKHDRGACSSTANKFCAAEC
jgi:hypothetical protein